MSWRPIESPCIKVCEIDAATQWCRGCQRSMREIASWGTLPQELRDRVMADLPARRAKMGMRADLRPRR
jgi:uncharacterized protein